MAWCLACTICTVRRIEIPQFRDIRNDVNYLNNNYYNIALPSLHNNAQPNLYVSRHFHYRNLKFMSILSII